MNPGSVGHAAHGQVHDLAGKAVFDAVLPVGGFLKEPLLPGLTLIAPQAHRGAIFGVEVGHLQHAAIGGGDGVAGTLPDHGLSGFLHNGSPPLGAHLTVMHLLYIL